jgi:hypothetical protein
MKNVSGIAFKAANCERSLDTATALLPPLSLHPLLEIDMSKVLAYRLNAMREPNPDVPDL